MAGNASKVLLANASLPVFKEHSRQALLTHQLRTITWFLSSTFSDIVQCRTEYRVYSSQFMCEGRICFCAKILTRPSSGAPDVHSEPTLVRVARFALYDERPQAPTSVGSVWYRRCRESIFAVFFVAHLKKRASTVS